MEPFGAALRACHDGDAVAELLLRRDDGQETPLPIRHFFRPPTEFTPIENAAIELCRGRVLDIGAGTGLHTLVLQARGLSVTAIDISPDAVAVMKARGVRDAQCADAFTFPGGPFDTLLLMGHGLGMVETIAGLDRFLTRVPGLLADDGQLLLDTLDVRVTDNPTHLAYHEANRRAGRYLGEIRLQFEFRGRAGPYCGWLQVDADTLTERADSAGLRCQVIRREPTGDYLSRLTAYD